jgi:parallel beta-helix repeat protein
MTIVYWDFLNGDDTTGDGSAGNPYKTLSKATSGLTGGDEVRCAKSPDPATLSGTLTFTDGSASVATSEDLTAVLGAMDFVSLNTAGETWWEIASINSTTITLVVAYRGTGGTGNGYKRGITGSIAGVTVADGSSTTAVHTISASGTSGATLKLSFGWNLSGTPAQDGETFFFQSNATKGGRAIYASSKNDIEIDGARFGLLRYNTGIYVSSSSNWTITSCTCNGNTYGIYVSSSINWTLTSCTCNGNSSIGIYGTSSSSNWTLTSCTCNGNSSTGISGTSSSSNWTLTSCTCNGNSGTGISGTSSSNWTITSPTCNGNAYGIYLAGGCSNIVAYGYAHDESIWSAAGKIYNWAGNGQKIVSIHESESGGAAKNRVYFYGGYTQNNAAEARSGECLQFNPKSATYWIEQSFFVPAAASTARTVSIYLKDDSSFNGNVYLELWFNGVRIAGPTEKTMDTSYAQFDITGAADDIPVAGVLELKVLVYGTAGCVYADDISYS